MTSVRWIDEFRFEIMREGKAIISGFIPAERIKRFPQNFITKADNMLKMLGINLEENKKKIINFVKTEDLANFLFIRCIFDYGGVTPSFILAERMLDLYRKCSFLFKPTDNIWTNITDVAMQLAILPIAGLLRTDFENIARWWRNIINFLREECNGDASNFFINMAERCGICIDDPKSLELLHLRLISGNILKCAGKKLFPYGDKNGRLMIALMSSSKRGFGVLKGVKPKHLRYFNLPVNSQVIRVTLNSGLIKFSSMNSDEYSISTRKRRKEVVRTGRGIKLDADIEKALIEICKKVWRHIANKIKLFPIDLDIYIWSLGAILCKRFGKFCSLCPLYDVCESVERGFVGESRGVDWTRGCFTLGKPQLNTIPIIRICKDCPDYNRRLKRCQRDRSYAVRKISEEELKILREVLYKPRIE